MSYINETALQHALSIPDLDTKVEAFAGMILEACKLHDPKFKAVTYADEEVLNVRDRRGRTKLMGDPARYIEVLYAGDDGAWETTDDARHILNVFVYRGIDGKMPAEADEKAFRALMESRNPAKPGVLFVLRAQTYCPVLTGPYAGTQLPLSPPTNVTASLVQLQDASGDWRHECAFRITIT